ncbi:MAG: NAD(P)-binding domain-containing protein [Actinomycetes bacterium]
MRCAVLGTGTVGATVAGALVGVGHEVRMGSRTADNETAAVWAMRHGEPASHGTFADAAGFGEVVVNATSGMASLLALEAAGRENLAGKVVVDIANPLDFSHGFPPSLSVCNTDSLGEQIQRAFPAARVVKTLNTVAAAVMVDPQQLESATDVFLCGDDASAKQVVRELLVQLGWESGHVLDLGGIVSARATEMYLPLWLSIMSAGGTPVFNVTVRRAHE